MKIRTDFVTNSSSYSSEDVVVDNPVLLEILQRYKDMGVFGEAKNHFKIAPEQDKSIAFTYDMIDSHNAPHLNSLQDVLEGIIYIIEESGEETRGYDMDLYEKMKTELEDRQDEIMKGFIRIDWLLGETTNEYGYERWVQIEDNFKYNNITGEEYYYCVKSQDTSEILEKDHRVNGMEIE